jgi:hypothetical protein
MKNKALFLIQDLLRDWLQDNRRGDKKQPLFLSRNWQGGKRDEKAQTRKVKLKKQSRLNKKF